MMTIYNPGVVRSAPRRISFDLAMIVSASLLIAVSAKVQVPFFPVPMTMQTFVVFGISLTLGPIRGSLAVLAYLFEGIAGFPVFAGSPEKGIGLTYILGPTGGYLLACLPAALLAGYLAERDRNGSFLSIVASAGVFLATIYVSGLLWLGIVIGFDAPLLRLGFFPFITADLLKVTAVALAFHFSRGWTNNGRGQADA
jgi:biotin transport system substrate-specific component